VERDKVKTAEAVDSSISLVVDEPESYVEQPRQLVYAIAGAAETAPENDQGRNDLLPARFTQISLLGEGGMSRVYKATDTANGDRVVAVKLLKKELSRDQMVIERFLREGKAMQALSHKNVAQIYDAGTTDDNVPYLVLEYVDGGSLADAIQREGHLNAERTRKIVTQVCHALEAAHHHYIIHRDIKPSNILLTTDENGEELAKLVDFGIAKPSSTEPLFNTDLTRTGMILGSPAYMSPEQCKGTDVDERSDFYSLGCVIYEALTGKCPFEAASPVKAIVRHLTEPPAPFDVQHGALNIPLGLEEVVMKCLEKQPRHRYQSARQLERALNVTIIPARKAVLTADAIDLFLYFFLAGLIDPAITSASLKLLHVTPPIVGWYRANTMAILPYLGAFIMPWIWSYAAYFGLFEASKWQATPGKLLNGIKVRDKNNRRLGVGAALLCPMAIASLMVTLWVTPMLIWTFLPVIHANSNWETAALILILVIIVTTNTLGLSVTGNPIGNLLLARTVGRPTASASPRRGHGTSFLQWIMLVFFAFLPVISAAGAMQFCRTMVDRGDVPMVVADHQIKAGEKITEKDLALIHTFKPFIPQHPIVHTIQELIGKTAKVSIPTGDPITSDEIMPQTK
jgi:serine/threonine protein kinase